MFSRFCPALFCIFQSISAIDFKSIYLFSLVLFEHRLITIIFAYLYSFFVSWLACWWLYFFFKDTLFAPFYCDLHFRLFVFICYSFLSSFSSAAIWCYFIKISSSFLGLTTSTQNYYVFFAWFCQFDSTCNNNEIKQQISITAFSIFTLDSHTAPSSVCDLSVWYSSYMVMFKAYTHGSSLSCALSRDSKHCTMHITSRTAFAVYFIILFQCSHAAWSDRLIQFKDVTNEQFTHLAVHPNGSHLYVGGVNKLYQLDSQLRLQQMVQLGPRMDSPECPVTGICPSVQKKLTNYYNKALLVDSFNDRLISCGSLFQVQR